MKDQDKRKFILKINGEKVIDIEASGSIEILQAFEDKVFKDTFGLFHNWSDRIGNMVLNGIEVKMSVIFRDKKGKFINPKKIIKTEKK